ncbi:hypothetical protein ACTFIR_009398 [Dictyostelium discoideum]
MFASACGNLIQSLGSIDLVLEVQSVANKTPNIALKFEISSYIVVTILDYPYLGHMCITIINGDDTIHKVNHEPNQEKYKVVEVKHQEWEEYQSQFIINHHKECLTYQVQSHQ